MEKEALGVIYSWCVYASLPIQKVHIAVFAPFANLVASVPWVPYNHTKIVFSLILLSSSHQLWCRPLEWCLFQKGGSLGSQEQWMLGRKPHAMLIDSDISKGSVCHQAVFDDDDFITISLLSGEDVTYVLPIIIWQFSANFRTGLIYGCICMMYIFLSYWFLLFFLSSPQQEACNRQWSWCKCSK